MKEEYEQAEQENEYKLSDQFHENFTLPEKRNKLGLYEVIHKGNNQVVFKCKSITKLSNWVYRCEEALKLYNKEHQGE